VLEPLSGYLLLGQKLFQEPELNGQPFNFGPNANQNFSVRELLERMNTIWKEGKWIENSDNDYSKQESQLLKLNCDKALHMLNWQAILDFKQTIDFTVSWYQNYYQNKNSVWDFSVNQIEKYIAAAIEKEQVWVKKENK
jgi:CDP-glucose 4,6-dehydratase